MVKKLRANNVSVVCHEGVECQLFLGTQRIYEDDEWRNRKRMSQQ